jgi:hypothetical protein
MRTANQLIAIVLWAVGLGMLCYQSQPVWGGLFFVPFALWPQFITHVGVFRAKSAVSQCILMPTLVLYFAWFVYVYLNFRRKQRLQNPGKMGISQLQTELVHVRSISRDGCNCKKPEEPRNFTLGNLRKFSYVDASYIHLDPQSAIALLFTGLAVVPIFNVEAYWILVVLWSLVFLIECVGCVKRTIAATNKNSQGCITEHRRP